MALRTSSSSTTANLSLNLGLSNIGCWSKQNLFTSSKKSPHRSTLVGGSPLALVVVFDVTQSGEYVIGGGIHDNASSKLRTGNEKVLILRGKMTKNYILYQILTWQLYNNMDMFFRR
jgi:hypothetical protein